MSKRERKKKRLTETEREKNNHLKGGKKNLLKGKEKTKPTVNDGKEKTF